FTRGQQAPRLDRVVVVDRARTAHRAQLVDLRLDVTGLVDGPALQDRRRTVPGEVDVESGERLGQHRRLESRRTPVAPAVRRDVDPLDAPAPRPRQSGDVVVAMV